MSDTQNPTEKTPQNSESDPDPSPSPNPNPVTPQPSNKTRNNKPHNKRRRDQSNYYNTNNNRDSKRGRVKSTTFSSNDLLYRIVVPAWQIGKVIGRGGNRIQSIRDQTRATIKIADAIARNEERVIIISSKFGDNVFSDAEKALHQIVNLILLDDGTKDPGQVGVGHVAPNAVRLLIDGSQAGALIGVAGQNIETLRNSSGATITVLAPNQLPPCASAHESDRVAQVSGDVPAVLRAVVEIGCQLRVNPPKQVISVNPSHTTSFHPNYPQPQHYMDPAQHYVDPSLVEHVTLDLMVPEKLVGGLIGRFGANISRIRNESGANIKVHGGRGEQTQRKIHLSGTALQVNLASQRVDEYVHAELMRQSGGQLPQTASTVQQVEVVSQVPMLEIPNPSYQEYGPPHPPPHPYPYPYPYPHSDPHSQPLPQVDLTSYEAALMAPPPPPPPPLTYAPAPVQQPPLTYAPVPTQQPPPPPPYYAYQPYPHYPAPPL